VPGGLEPADTCHQRLKCPAAKVAISSLGQHFIVSKFHCYKDMCFHYYLEDQKERLGRFLGFTIIKREPGLLLGTHSHALFFMRSQEEMLLVHGFLGNKIP
jgi:hypothetical protein